MVRLAAGWGPWSTGAPKEGTFVSSQSPPQPLALYSVILTGCWKSSNGYRRQ